MEQAPDGAAQADAGYRERLWPSTAIWALVPADALVLAVVFTPFGGLPALAAALVGAAATLVLLVRGTATVAVAGGMLVAGRARIPVELLGPAEQLDPEAMRRARGTGLDARAYLCLRGWLHRGLRVPVLDPADPTPYWLVSSRHPARLAGALEAARGAPATPGHG